MNNYFKIKDTIKFIDNKFNSSGFYKVFPKVKEELMGYEEVINKASSTAASIRGYQVFEIPINLEGNDLYYLQWDVLKPELYNIKPVLFPIDSPSTYSDCEHIYQNKVLEYSKLLVLPPIVIARCPAMGQDIVIDGNHRLHALKAKGIRQIEAIVLEPSVHISYMLSDRAKALYKVHHNLVFLLRLFSQPLNSLNYSCDESLSLKCYYPLRQSIIFRKIYIIHWAMYSLPERLRE
jgi:hypothetical protein